MHEFCIEWAQKPPQILREHLPDWQASLPRPTEEGEHRKYPQSPARRGRLQNGRFATRQCLHGASDKECYVIIPSFLCSIGRSTIPCMQGAAATAVNNCKKTVHLHCFVGSDAKQIISACRLTV